MTRALALAACVLAVSACSTGYVPRSPGRVFVVMDSGAPAYVRDGQTIRHGFLGSGLEEAVRGNPQAEAAAREYHDRQRDGLVATLVGAVCMGTAMGMAVSDAATADGSNHDRAIETKLLVGVGCFAVMMGGTIYIASAEPYRYDAINIFNDNPPPAPPQYYPGYGPGYGASPAPLAKPAASLGMR